MEKLIELLNEYGEYDLVEHNGEICKWTTDDEGEINIYTDYTNNIISKKFGFIEWLVEHNKINFYEGKYLEYPIGSNNYNECDYLELIQWLAISDTPIDDLIGYLK